MDLSIDTPGMINSLSNVSEVATESESEHVCVLEASGKIFCWGNNENGQLGNGSTSNSDNPAQVSGITNAIQVAVGSDTLRVALGLDLSCWGAEFRRTARRRNDQPTSQAGSCSRAQEGSAHRHWRRRDVRADGGWHSPGLGIQHSGSIRRWHHQRRPPEPRSDSRPHGGCGDQRRPPAPVRAPDEQHRRLLGQESAGAARERYDNRQLGAGHRQILSPARMSVAAPSAAEGQTLATGHLRATSTGRRCRSCKAWN